MSITEQRKRLTRRYENQEHVDAAFWTIIQFEHVRESWRNYNVTSTWKES